METNGKSDEDKRDIEEIVQKEISDLVNCGLKNAKDMDEHNVIRITELNIENSNLSGQVSSLQERIKEYEKQENLSQNKYAQEIDELKKNYEFKMANLDKSYIIKEAELNRKISDIEDKYKKEKISMDKIISDIEEETKSKEKENTETLQNIGEGIAVRNKEHDKELKELKDKYESERIILESNYANEIGSLKKKSEDEVKVLLEKIIDIKDESLKLKNEYSNLGKQKEKKIEEQEQKCAFAEREKNRLSNELKQLDFFYEKLKVAYEGKVSEEKVLGKKNQEENQYGEKMISQLEELGKNLDKLGKNFKKLQEGKTSDMYQKIEKIDKNLDYMVSRVEKPEVAASGAKDEQ